MLHGYYPYPLVDADITWQVTPVSATPGSGYKPPTAPKTTRIRFGPNRGFATIPNMTDTLPEGDETFQVTILSAQACCPPPDGVSPGGPTIPIYSATGTVTILDDDPSAPYADSRLQAATPLGR